MIVVLNRFMEIVITKKGGNRNPPVITVVPVVTVITAVTAPIETYQKTMETNGNAKMQEKKQKSQYL